MSVTAATEPNRQLIQHYFETLLKLRDTGWKPLPAKLHRDGYTEYRVTPQTSEELFISLRGPSQRAIVHYATLGLNDNNVVVNQSGVGETHTKIKKALDARDLLIQIVNSCVNHAVSDRGVGTEHFLPGEANAAAEPEPGAQDLRVLYQMLCRTWSRLKGFQVLPKPLQGHGITGYALYFSGPPHKQSIDITLRDEAGSTYDHTVIPMFDKDKPAWLSVRQHPGSSFGVQFASSEKELAFKILKTCIERNDFRNSSGFIVKDRPVTGSTEHAVERTPADLFSELTSRSSTRRIRYHGQDFVVEFERATPTHKNGVIYVRVVDGDRLHHLPTDLEYDVIKVIGVEVKFVFVGVHRRHETEQWKNLAAIKHARDRADLLVQILDVVYKHMHEHKAEAAAEPEPRPVTDAFHELLRTGSRSWKSIGHGLEFQAFVPGENFNSNLVHVCIRIVEEPLLMFSFFHMPVGLINEIHVTCANLNISTGIEFEAASAKDLLQQFVAFCVRKLREHGKQHLVHAAVEPHQDQPASVFLDQLVSRNLNRTLKFRGLDVLVQVYHAHQPHLHVFSRTRNINYSVIRDFDVSKAEWENCGAVCIIVKDSNSVNYGKVRHRIHTAKSAADFLRQVLEFVCSSAPVQAAAEPEPTTAAGYWLWQLVGRKFERYLEIAGRKASIIGQQRVGYLTIDVAAPGGVYRIISRSTDPKSKKKQRAYDTSVVICDGDQSSSTYLHQLHVIEHAGSVPDLIRQVLKYVTEHERRRPNVEAATEPVPTGHNRNAFVTAFESVIRSMLQHPKQALEIRIPGRNGVQHLVAFRLAKQQFGSYSPDDVLANYQLSLHAPGFATPKTAYASVFPSMRDQKHHVPYFQVKGRKHVQDFDDRNDFPTHPQQVLPFLARVFLEQLIGAERVQAAVEPILHDRIGYIRVELRQERLQEFETKVKKIPGVTWNGNLETTWTRVHTYWALVTVSGPHMEQALQTVVALARAMESQSLHVPGGRELTFLPRYTPQLLQAVEDGVEYMRANAATEPGADLKQAFEGMLDAFKYHGNLGHLTEPGKNLVRHDGFDYRIWYNTSQPRLWIRAYSTPADSDTEVHPYPYTVEYRQDPGHPETQRVIVGRTPGMIVGAHDVVLEVTEVMSAQQLTKTVINAVIADTHKRAKRSATAAAEPEISNLRQSFLGMLDAFTYQAGVGHITEPGRNLIQYQNFSYRIWHKPTEPKLWIRVYRTPVNDIDVQANAYTYEVVWREDRGRPETQRVLVARTPLGISIGAHNVVMEIDNCETPKALTRKVLAAVIAETHRRAQHHALAAAEPDSKVRGRLTFSFNNSKKNVDRFAALVKEKFPGLVTSPKPKNIRSSFPAQYWFSVYPALEARTFTQLLQAAKACGAVEVYTGTNSWSIEGLREPALSATLWKTFCQSANENRTQASTEPQPKQWCGSLKFEFGSAHADALRFAKLVHDKFPGSTSPAQVRNVSANGGPAVYWCWVSLPTRENVLEQVVKFATDCNAEQIFTNTRFWSMDDVRNHAGMQSLWHGFTETVHENHAQAAAEPEETRDFTEELEKMAAQYNTAREATWIAPHFTCAGLSRVDVETPGHVAVRVYTVYVDFTATTIPHVSKAETCFRFWVCMSYNRNQVRNASPKMQLFQIAEDASTPIRRVQRQIDVSELSPRDLLRRAVSDACKFVLRNQNRILTAIAKNPGFDKFQGVTAAAEPGNNTDSGTERLFYALVRKLPRYEDRKSKKIVVGDLCFYLSYSESESATPVVLLRVLTVARPCRSLAMRIYVKQNNGQSHTINALRVTSILSVGLPIGKPHVFPQVSTERALIQCVLSYAAGVYNADVREPVTAATEPVEKPDDNTSAFYQFADSLPDYRFGIPAKKIQVRGATLELVYDDLSSSVHVDVSRPGVPHQYVAAYFHRTIKKVDFGVLNKAHGNILADTVQHLDVTSARDVLQKLVAYCMSQHRGVAEAATEPAMENRLHDLWERMLAQTQVSVNGKQLQDYKTIEHDGVGVVLRNSHGANSDVLFLNARLPDGTWTSGTVGWEDEYGIVASFSNNVRADREFDIKEADVRSGRVHNVQDLVRLVVAWYVDLHRKYETQGGRGVTTAAAEPQPPASGLESLFEQLKASTTKQAKTLTHGGKSVRVRYEEENECLRLTPQSGFGAHGTEISAFVYSVEDAGGFALEVEYSREKHGKIHLIRHATSIPDLLAQIMTGWNDALTKTAEAAVEPNAGVTEIQPIFESLCSGLAGKQKSVTYRGIQATLTRIVAAPRDPYLRLVGKDNSPGVEAYIVHGPGRKIVQVEYYRGRPGSTEHLVQIYNATSASNLLLQILQAWKRFEDMDRAHAAVEPEQKNDLIHLFHRVIASMKSNMPPGIKISGLQVWRNNGKLILCGSNANFAATIGEDHKNPQRIYCSFSFGGPGMRKYDAWIESASSPQDLLLQIVTWYKQNLKLRQAVVESATEPSDLAHHFHTLLQQLPPAEADAQQKPKLIHGYDVTVRRSTGGVTIIAEASPPGDRYTYVVAFAALTRDFQHKDMPYIVDVEHQGILGHIVAADSAKDLLNQFMVYVIQELKKLPKPTQAAAELEVPGEDRTLPDILDMLKQPKHVRVQGQELLVTPVPNQREGMEAQWYVTVPAVTEDRKRLCYIVNVGVGTQGMYYDVNRYINQFTMKRLPGHKASEFGRGLVALQKLLYRICDSVAADIKELPRNEIHAATEPDPENGIARAYSSLVLSLHDDSDGSKIQHFPLSVPGYAVTVVRYSSYRKSDPLEADLGVHVRAGSRQYHFSADYEPGLVRFTTANNARQVLLKLTQAGSGKTLLQHLVHAALEYVERQEQHTEAATEPGKAGLEATYDSLVLSFAFTKHQIQYKGQEVEVKVFNPFVVSSAISVIVHGVDFRVWNDSKHDQLARIAMAPADKSNVTKPSAVFDRQDATRADLLLWMVQTATELARKRRPKQAHAAAESGNEAPVQIAFRRAAETVDKHIGDETSYKVHTRDGGLRVTPLFTEGGVQFTGFRHPPVLTLQNYIMVLTKEIPNTPAYDRKVHGVWNIPGHAGYRDANHGIVVLLEGDVFPVPDSLDPQQLLKNVIATYLQHARVRVRA